MTTTEVRLLEQKAHSPSSGPALAGSPWNPLHKELTLFLQRSARTKRTLRHLGSTGTESALT